MDGWETRRRRRPGPDTADHAIVRLGMPGSRPPDRHRHRVLPRQLPAGRRPSRRARPTGTPAPHELDRVDDARRAAAPDGRQRAPRRGPRRPPLDARPAHDLPGRRRGAPARATASRCPTRGCSPQTVDLAALENGGRILGCSNEFYSSPNNLIKPGLPRTMGDGWETARRRDDGNDWVVAAARVRGTGRSSPRSTPRTSSATPPAGSTLTTSDGAELLPRTPLQPDTRHRFVLPGAVADEVRVDVFPDGGLGRLRLFGAPTEDGRRALGLRFLNALPDAHADAALGACCRARRGSLRCATAARSQISMRCSYARTRRRCPWTTADSPRLWPGIRASASDRAVPGRARNSPASATTPASSCSPRTPSTRQRFGHVYLVCATGLSGEELLAICRERLATTPPPNDGVALGELAKINRIRLHKLLGLAP